MKATEYSIESYIWIYLMAPLKFGIWPTFNYTLLQQTSSRVILFYILNLDLCKQNKQFLKSFTDLNKCGQMVSNRVE